MLRRLRQFLKSLRGGRPSPATARSRARSPESEVLKTAGQSAMDAGDWQAAAEAYRKVVELEGDAVFPKTLAKLARCERNLGQLDAAEAAIARAIERFPRSKRAVAEGVVIAMRLERWAAAAARGEALVRLEGEEATARAFVQWALACRNSGDLAAAKAVLDRGLARHPEDVDLRNDAADLAVAIGRSKRAPVRRAEVPSGIGIDRICECFWSLEEKLSLLSWNVNGVFPWPLMRMQLFYSVAQQAGQYGPPHPAIRAPAAKAADAERLEAWWTEREAAPAGDPSAAGRPYAVLMATRKVGGSELYSEALRSELGARAWLLDRAFTGSVADGALDFDALLRLFRARYRRREDALFPYEDRLLCERIREAFDADLRIDVGELSGSFQQRIGSFLTARRGFEAFFDMHPVRTLFLTFAYGISTRAAVAGARRHGARVVELQHGTITRFHLGYSWPGRPDVPDAPDELWCFGKFWHETTPLPRGMSARVIGAPYVHRLAEAAGTGTRDAKQVVFTSQGVIGRRLFDAALDTARRRADLRIVFRLHPSEALETYEELLRGSGPLPANFSLSHRTPNIFALLAASGTQVGAFSTTLLEGMALGTRAVVLELPGSEYMRAVVERGDALFVRDVAELAAKIDQAPLAADPGYYYAKPVERLVDDDGSKPGVNR